MDPIEKAEAPPPAPPIPTLYFVCPFDGQKWALHTQEQMDRLRRHIAVHVPF